MGMSALTHHRAVSLETARRALDAVCGAARELGICVSVAIVDPSGHLMTYDRMDGAPLLTAQLAQDKAYTAAAFGLATHEWWDLVRDNPALLHGLPKTDRLIIFGGGIPIITQGEVVGAIGVSGGSPDQDQALADQGVATVTPLLFDK